MRPNLFPIRRGRQPQNENAVPFKVQMPLALRNSVTGKGTKGSDKGCLYEISLVMSCLQQNNFENKFCTKEVTAFQNCYRNYEANRANTMEQTRKGILTPYSKDLKHNQVNILLKKYPQS